jgi:hypothetical protein
MSKLSCSSCLANENLSTALLTSLSLPGSPVISVLSRLTCLGHLSDQPVETLLLRLSCPDCPARLSCPGCPVPAVLSGWSCPRCPLSRSFCFSCPVLAVMFWPFSLCFLSWPYYPVCLLRLSCPGCPVPKILSRLSCLSCPIPAFLSQLSCSGCPVPAVLFRLSCSGCPIPAVVFFAALPRHPCPQFS